MGKIEAADGGTLFLDEIGEMPMGLQVKILRVLQERAVTRVGDNKPEPIDVRVISATHRALRDETAEGRFREDLRYRIRVVPLFLPPLRERAGDVERLVWHFIDRGNEGGLRRVERVRRAERESFGCRSEVLDRIELFGRVLSFDEPDCPSDRFGDCRFNAGGAQLAPRNIDLAKRLAGAGDARRPFAVRWQINCAT